MLVLTVYVLTFAVGFPANVFTFLILLSKTRRGVSSSDILLLNLTAADLLLLLFLPFKMAETAAGMIWPLPMSLCPVANFCFYASIYLSSLFLAALSVERYLGVVFPLRFKNRRRPARAMAASVVLWLLACSHCSVVFVAHYHPGGNQATADNSPSPNATAVSKCYDDFSDDQLSFVLPLRLELFLLLFLLPFAVTVFCYVNFIRVLLARPNLPSEKKQRAVGLALATVINFGVCFAPYNVSHVVGFVEKRSPDWRIYALVFTSLNAALDPLVFYFSSTTVQKAVVKVVVAIGGKFGGR
ncbi:free fatty acid receptor 2-like [Athene noctua]|uniref:free fatty acid receptor 2-like n=1 Tax=Athene noctua TaxID=126797 RepID=UPI003EB89280